MLIDCISDLHGSYPSLEGGDLLIVAGDLTANDTYNDWIVCDQWIRSQKYKYKKVVVIAGNHDSYLYDGFDNPFFLPFSDYEPDSRDQIPFATYLCDSGTEFEGLKIWGSPWTLYFEGMYPDCCAFTLMTEEELAEKFALIPDDTDILITHSPPAGILDQTERKYRVGSKALRCELLRIKPQLHVFGHIHEAYGQDREEWGNADGATIYVNASHVNKNYKPVNKPIRVIL